MKILILVIGPVSFKAAVFVRSFIKQLATQEHHSITIMAESHTFSFLQLMKNQSFKEMGENFSEDDFENYLDNSKPELLIVVNLDLLIFDDSNLIFKKSFLKHIRTRTLFLVSNSSLVFKDNYTFISGKPNSKLKINAPFALLKSCPPYIPDMDYGDENSNGIKTIYWKNLEQFAFLNRIESKSNLKLRIKGSEESKIVTLLPDLEQTFAAGAAGIGYHYKILIECICQYLGNLKVPCNLVVGNLTHIPIDYNAPNVKVCFFGPLVVDDEYDQIIRSTDLLITETIANPILMDAANLKIPTINLKNTLVLDKAKDENGNLLKNEEGNDVIDIVFNFEKLTDFAQSKVEELMAKCPKSIFPYFSFPNHAKVNFNETKVFGHYIFNFSELFDENGTTNLMKELLLNEEAIKEEVYRIEQYLALRSDSMEAPEILESL